MLSNYPSSNQTVIELTPWNTTQNQQLLCLFPQIIYKNKIKHKPQSKQTKFPQPPSQNSIIIHQKSQQEHKIPSKNIDKKMQYNQKRREKLCRQNYEQKQNSLNFIKNSKKNKNKQRFSLMLQPQPPITQRKTIQSIDRIPFKISTSEKLHQNDQNVFNRIKNTQDLKLSIKKIKDIHNLYLMDKIQHISHINTDKSVRQHQQYSNWTGKDLLLQKLSQQNQYPEYEIRNFSQRTQRNYNIKTQGCQNQVLDRFLAKKDNKITIKNTPYLTHRRQKHIKSHLLIDEGQRNPERTIISKINSAQLFSGNISERSHLNKEEFKEKQKMTKLSEEISDKLKQTLLIEDAQKQVLSSRFPSVKPKIFIVHKAQMTLKQDKENIQISAKEQRKVLSSNDNLLIDQQMKKNLRRLRGYIVKKARDHCMLKGTLNEHQLSLYENGINTFTTQ